MKIREKLRAIRAELKALFRHSVYDAAAFNGLAIEYPEGMPVKFGGLLDPHEAPRFIAVNPDLPREEQVYIIAREIGRYAQIRRLNSPFINHPRKWDLFATAPTATRDLIDRLDLEVRTYNIMYWHAGKNDFFTFLKRHRKELWSVWFTNAISDYIFFKLRIRRFFYAVLSTLRLASGT